MRRVLNRILKNLNCADKELSLLFVDDEGIRNINRHFLYRDHPTNVISFSMREGPFGDINPDILGDIVISLETAFRDAREAAVSFHEELDFLMIHGLLHLLGYNHEGASEDEVKQMEEKERELFLPLKNKSAATGSKRAVNI